MSYFGIYQSSNIVSLWDTFPAEYLPPLPPTLYTLHQKNAPKCDFSCISAKIVVPLRGKCEKQERHPMNQEKKYDVFISYRREGGKNIARLLKTELGLRGYHAFLDFDELKDGRFDKRIMDAIDAAPVFMFILSEHALDRCVDENDWVRKEIEYAMATERHIIPINPDKSFSDFPDCVPKNLKDGLGVHQFSQLLLDDLFNQTMDKLVAERLEPVLGKRNRYQMSTTGATIHLSTDANCEVYRYGKHECNVVTGEDKIMCLKKGKHKFEFVSIDNEKIKYSIVFSVDDIDMEDLIEITLLPSIQKREQEEREAAERARHVYVDLGLSVKWATCNVGAREPEDYGDYFAWGETRPKSIYNWSTYKWCNGVKDSLTKYKTESGYGTLNNKTRLDLSDDAARANWGGSWRMPTDAEWIELTKNCTWTWTTQNGVEGYKVTSEKNGNSIFLPAAGYRSDSSLYYAGSCGYYWSSSLDTFGKTLYLLIGSSSVRGYGRYCGLSVRPVCP